ncbi:hypothetical protein IscW_ISCW021188 [Ixodes scapularis]|uniref:Uncharacterized protein n=1 Tax=Ixodes scapularis TaxID=6945 RepID=B7Q8W3_IXOSC|nr:hypothetical protein IscW_ISCW021188 [Ixodes scapularis]|eukprot:XP_002405448.1 hypothetical protein IscW_ISCW021188 [Ixodes scapularis]
MDSFVQGFPDFKLRVNFSKMETNLKVDRIPLVLPQDSVHFCGFVFDTVTLEVTEEPEDAARPLTRRSRSSEAGLMPYLEHWQIQLRPLILDSTLNSRNRMLATLFAKVFVFADRFFFTVDGMRYVNGPYVATVFSGALDCLLMRLFRCATTNGFELFFSVGELRLVFWEVVLRKAGGRNRAVRAAVRTTLTDVRKKVPASSAEFLVDYCGT